MIKRVYIICEGETEQEFCANILTRYFQPKEIIIHYPLIKKSMGGVVNWSYLKKQIEFTLKSDKYAYVSTLIDYYGISLKHNFPDWAVAKSNLNIYSKIDILEQGMYNDIDKKLSRRFIPYVQLHEFEGLLFNDENVFYKVIPESQLIGKKELKEIFENFDNPEMINDNPDSAPSKRLERIIKGYNKIVYGNIIAEEIGIENIRQKSLHFDNWISKIEGI